MELCVYNSSIVNFDSLATQLFVPIFQSGQDAILNVQEVFF